MNRLITIVFFTLLCISCGKKEETKANDSATPAENPTELGKALFEGTGNCFACHKPDQKIIGPSIQEIAKTYKMQGGDIVSFLKGESKPLVDPGQYEVMKTNFAITKNMSDEELNALEAYIDSFRK